MKRSPVATAQRQAVRHHEQGLRVDAHAGVACTDLYVFNLVVAAVLNAGPPMADPVPFAINRSGWNGWSGYSKHSISGGVIMGVYVFNCAFPNTPPAYTTLLACVAHTESVK